MDLRHLRYFVTVAEEMHFGRAAARLGISQPPLSQQIRALEAEFGIDLFDRTSRRVALTEAGRLLLPEARQTIAQADRAIRALRRARSGEVGRLAIGFTSSGPFIPNIAKALYQFRQLFPDIELELNELGRDEQIASLEEGRIDVGMIRDLAQPALPAGVVSHLLLKEDVLLALSRGHRLAAREGPIALEEIADEDFVLYHPMNGTGFNEHFFSRCADAGFVPRINQEASSLATLLGLISAGFGMSPLSRSLTRLHPDEIVCREFAGDRMESHFWLVHRGPESPAAANFIACIEGI